MFSGSATSGLDSDRFSAEGAFGHNRQPQNETSDGWPRIGEAARQQDPNHQDNYGSSGFGSSSLLSGLERQRTNTNPASALLSSQDPSRVTSPEGTSQSCKSPALLHLTTTNLSTVLSSRSPMQGINGTIGQERPSGEGIPQPPGLDTLSAVRQSHFQRSSPQSAAATQQTLLFGKDPMDVSTPTSQSQGPQSLTQMLSSMSERDRFSLPGLMAMKTGPSADARSITQGQDIHNLGLDLRQATPLHTTFMSPFAAQGSAPPRPLETDFTLPDCYNVHNVIPLDQRINGFSEETLLYIFYSMPRDIMQEMVAEELMGRKWRFHKTEKMWLTRDEQAPAPVELEPGVRESGTYLWWDYRSWRKIRKQYVLRYDDLDDHLQKSSGLAGAMGNGLAIGNGSFNAVPGLERMAAGIGRGF
jgi:CCR4-NOT transcription complex subunit 2